ncbi:uncharacterized protein P884DRAFT_291590 [Thermothelomyces heterothallicus CBS 202.75]|uniref:uncharacterized protein n=1 Tax=Thermothelomyces heterothallicus CBS 202.75 TaxID=1149848 RepID=UPI0037434D55
MFANWHSANATWKPVNISDRMLTSQSPIFPKLGTPLACLTWDNSMPLWFFIDENNTVCAVHTGRRRLYGLETLGASSLAGYWFYCWVRRQDSEEGQNKVQVFVEGEPGGKLQLWVDKTLDTDFSVTGRAGSGLATTASLATSGEMRMLLFFDAGDKLGMMHRNSANDSTWVLDGQQITATSFPIHYEDGTTPPGWAILAVQLEKLVGGPEPPPAFTAIGINLDLRFNGIADGAILEYRQELRSPTFGTLKNLSAFGNEA